MAGEAGGAGESEANAAAKLAAMAAVVDHDLRQLEEDLLGRGYKLTRFRFQEPNEGVPARYIWRLYLDVKGGANVT